MGNLVTRVFDKAFGRPQGWMGWAGGSVMALLNVEQERWAVDRAALQPGERVLVVGHGPGVGLRLCADAVGPTGHVLGVDPSATMREMAASRCRVQVEAGVVEVRDGSAERTGRADASCDAAISVNNVMLWNRGAGFAELFRVLRPNGRLVLTVHRHVLDVPPRTLRSDAEAAGFSNVGLTARPRRLGSPAIELVATRPAS
ncbi:methyltransferase domain-containing protein [Saccharopolyspora rhizosphaerae]|uniref:Methyltransferase domain-containing protein n=1 Tax=Saccharopolyspora rhizosphaerae TaxID=2492662 RepID=A0A426JN89_9PSEU|nr:methyltransferase domain-containing protein [Saccharopolyspora rhizosphaerae]RRO14723.1 methyltransferase domain-containing protein [Saccharopolyspora rhizosphaerae]